MMLFTATDLTINGFVKSDKNEFKKYKNGFKKSLNFAACENQ